jgi:hypothetical protein
MSDRHWVSASLEALPSHLKRIDSDAAIGLIPAPDLTIQDADVVVEALG